MCAGTNAYAHALRCGCGFAFMATQAEGRTDVAFSTGLDPSLAALHLKEEMCVCVGGNLLCQSVLISVYSSPPNM